MTDPEPLYHLTRRLLEEHRQARLLRQMRAAKEPAPEPEQEPEPDAFTDADRAWLRGLRISV